MDEKDKEAFDDFIEANIDFYSNAPTRIKSANEAWQAACEYKDKEQYIEGSIHESEGIKREMTWKESSDMFERMYMNTLTRLHKEYERVRELQAYNKKLYEALKETKE